MCGKFTQMFSWAELFALYDIKPDNLGESPIRATPMGGAWIVRSNPNSGDRVRTLMRWGWGDGRNENFPKHIHARGETVDTLPTFRDAFRNDRGVLLVDSFNEGEEVPTYYKDGEDAQQPWTRGGFSAAKI